MLAFLLQTIDNGISHVFHLVVKMEQIVGITAGT